MAAPARSRLDRFRYEYGAEPLHLIATVASLAAAGYAFLRIFENPGTGGVLLWFGAAIVLHDLVALPLYSLLGRIAEETTDLAVRPRRRMLLTLNHIRIPVAFSLLLLLISFPLVFEVDPGAYELTTGLDTGRYLGNWLAITAVLFTISGIDYALRLRRRNVDAPMIRAPSRRPNDASAPAPTPPGLGWRIGARLTLGVLALLGAWVAVVAIGGLITTFPG
jgi:hypothetical protein